MIELYHICRLLSIVYLFRRSSSKEDFSDVVGVGGGRDVTDNLSLGSTLVNQSIDSWFHTTGQRGILFPVWLETDYYPLD